jgi:hypothetical protein
LVSGELQGKPLVDLQENQKSKSMESLESSSIKTPYEPLRKIITFDPQVENEKSDSKEDEKIVID